jgi:Family of unknown function (DUF6510)
MSLTLDGNAVGGLLGEIFAAEMTTARGACGNCGAVEPLGAVLVYLHAPGVVIRCPHCDNVLIRIVRNGSGRLWLDVSGVRSLELRIPG